MSLEENKVIIRSLYEADNRKDLSLLDKYISPDFFEATLQMRGPEPYKQFEKMFFKAFPDWQENIEDMVAEGDKVWVYFNASGTHMGELSMLGVTLPPTGKKVGFKAVQMWHLVDGMVVEKKSVADELEAFKELDLIEPKGVGKQLFKE